MDLKIFSFDKESDFATKQKNWLKNYFQETLHITETSSIELKVKIWFDIIPNTYNFFYDEIFNQNKNPFLNKLSDNFKNKFYEEDFDDWTIEDVLAKFPPEWNWEYNQTDSKIEI